jgi:formamidopyrimidine-DNA glycosylase
MPELPEVESLCRQLRKTVLFAEVLDTEVFDQKLMPLDQLKGTKIITISREGKFIKMSLDSGMEVMLHLRMTGKLLWQEKHSSLPPHTRFIISFKNGNLACIDPRRFATIRIRHPQCCSSGLIDPLKSFHPHQLSALAVKRTLPIKNFLMEQCVIGGIGNIYACEILHEAAINPGRKTNSLSMDEWEKVAMATRSILKKAIACRGTTVSDWRDLFGQKGTYQVYLKAYAREGQRCHRCNVTIQRTRLSGRGTYYCPSCQK